MTTTYVVEVQHPCIEHEGVVYPNFLYLGTVLAEDAEDALAVAKSEWKHAHAPALLTVTPLED